jgi:hypothetical protein
LTTHGTVHASPHLHHPVGALTFEQVISTGEFEQRNARRADYKKECQSLYRLAAVFAQEPEKIMDELVRTAIDLCGADSAGISVEEQLPSGKRVFRWVATAGVLAPFINQIAAPRDFSPCGVTLDRDAVQLFKHPEKHYLWLAASPQSIHEALLIPWSTSPEKGTLWIISHRAAHKFDGEDARLMRGLADFTTMALRFRHTEADLRRSEKIAAEFQLANNIAHEINNPLQAVVNAMYLVEVDPTQTKHYIATVGKELKRISALLEQIFKDMRERRQGVRTPARARKSKPVRPLLGHS